MLSRRERSWAILPATMTLWDKKKITVMECASVWDDGTVLVCRNDQNRICFIHGCQGDYGVKIGDRNDCHHDQTGANKGSYLIVNILNWKKVGNDVVIESVLPFDRQTKASLAVFK